jgi:hypothetical protein
MAFEFFHNLNKSLPESKRAYKYSYKSLTTQRLLGLPVSPDMERSALMYSLFGNAHSEAENPELTERWKSLIK